MNHYQANICNFRTIRDGFIEKNKTIINSNWQYNIPIYQRLFVWGNEQIKNLLDDLVRAFNKNKLAPYYLGGIVVVKNNNKYDLVDGQQRFTALWLISTVLDSPEFKLAENHLKAFAYLDDNNLRLSFSIREGVKEFFEQLKKDGTVSKEVENIEGLDTISKAFTQIKTYFQAAKNKENDLKLSSEEISDFTKYAIDQIEFIFTEVPANSDLNKLFEVINARGLQLEHHEILKALMRGKIKNESTRYMQLWDACSYMQNYIEQNLKLQIESGITWRDLLVLMKEKSISVDDEEINVKGYNFDKSFVDNFCNLEKKTPANDNNIIKLDHLRENPVLLIDILKEENPKYIVKEKKEKKEECESIISFNLLLIHTLRIFLKEHGESDISGFEEKELLQVFKKHFFKKDISEEDEKVRVIEFLKLLGKIRIVFDEFIIKRAQSEDGFYHQIQSMKCVTNQKDNSAYPDRRKLKETDDVSLLQSMLYYSQSKPHFWLTPYLFYLYKKDGIDSLKILQQIDNYFFCSDLPGTYKEKGWEVMHNIPNLDVTDYQKFMDNLKSEFGNGINDESKLKIQTNYHRFGSYSFYKLEYILWRNKESILDQTEKSNETIKNVWYNYKMTSKNSVEHIYPQTPPKGSTVLENCFLHDFGNLVLITTGINSEYSNLPVNEKESKFNNKIDIGKIDSLKSFMLFKYNDWSEFLNIDKVKLNLNNHRESMINYFEDYFEKTTENDQTN